tara:strand:+ start:110 stop:364 length:255 start_codon:yes stop_codon:yes gene_type:complete
VIKMKETYEHDYVVYKTSDGPKVINESLNTYGKDGWGLVGMITVGGGEHLVAWLRKTTYKDVPDPKKAEQSKIAKLWGAADGDE